MMRWAGHVVRVGEVAVTFKLLIPISEEKILLRIPSHGSKA
jgi:hypothetical protein